MKDHHHIYVTHAVIIGVVAIVAIVSLAMLWLSYGRGGLAPWEMKPYLAAGFQGQGADSSGGGSAGRPLGSFCSADADCLSGDCSGQYYDKNGNVIENKLVCV